MIATIDALDAHASRNSRPTLKLCVVLVGIGIIGLVAQQYGAAALPSSNVPGTAPRVPILLVYFSLIASEVLLLRLVWRSVHRVGDKIVDLISSRPLTAGALTVDFIIGLGMICTLTALELVVLPSVLPGHSGGPSNMTHALAAHAASLAPIWIVLSLLAAFAEELTFRGFLQRQFGQLFRNKWLAVVLQALLFGIVHGYQGAGMVAATAIFGLYFGAIAVVRRSLIPGILAHSAIDLIGGLSGLA